MSYLNSLWVHHGAYELTKQHKGTNHGPREGCTSRGNDSNHPEILHRCP